MDGSEIVLILFSTLFYDFYWWKFYITMWRCVLRFLLFEKTNFINSISISFHSRYLLSIFEMFFHTGQKKIPLVARYGNFNDFLVIIATIIILNILFLIQLISLIFQKFFLFVFQSKTCVNIGFCVQNSELKSYWRYIC